MLKYGYLKSRGDCNSIFNMAKLENLPSLALENIIKRLSIQEKVLFFKAVSVNENLKHELDCLKIKRRKYCPFCILQLGINYEGLIFGPKYLTIGEQILNSSSGDQNWKWVTDHHGLKLVEITENLEHEVLIRVNCQDSPVDIIELLEQNDNEEFSQSKIDSVTKEFRSLYFQSNKAKQVRAGFTDSSELFEHFNNEHVDLFYPDKFLNSKKNKYCFESYLNELFLIEYPTVEIYREQNRMNIIQSIFILIASNVLGFNQIYEDALEFPNFDESEFAFFKSQLSSVFELSVYTIQSIVLSQQNRKTSFQLMFIRRLLKTFTIFNLVFFHLSDDF